MEIVYLVRSTGRDRIKIHSTENSSAIFVPDDFEKMTVVLSVASGAATVQFSLATQDEVKEDEASWHDWSLGAVTSFGGIAFDSPISYIRVVVAAETTYTLEVLS